MASPTIKSCKSIDLVEDYLVDLDASIQETKFTLGSLSQIKQTILNNSDMISNSFFSTLSQFSLSCQMNPSLNWRTTSVVEEC